MTPRRTCLDATAQSRTSLPVTKERVQTVHSPTEEPGWRATHQPSMTRALSDVSRGQTPIRTACPAMEGTQARCSPTASTGVLPRLDHLGQHTGSYPSGDAVGSRHRHRSRRSARSWRSRTDQRGPMSQSSPGLQCEKTGAHTWVMKSRCLCSRADGSSTVPDRCGCRKMGPGGPCPSCPESLHAHVIRAAR